MKTHVHHVTLLTFIVAAAALVGCGAHYRYNVPKQLLEAPETQMWAVGWLKSNRGYRVASMTRLNGTTALPGEAMVPVASGSAGNWIWEVRAVGSLLPSWRKWQNDARVQQRAQQDDWEHPAANWEQAFNRAYAVASYLLGRTPLPAKVTLLLVPNGTLYQKTIVEADDRYIPLSFAFYYPPSAAQSDMGDRFSALVEAVSRTLYEYQHVLVDTQSVVPMGTTDAKKSINDEARSQCWFDSTMLALSSGTTSQIEPAPAAATEPSLAKKRVAHAVFWGRYLQAKSVADYLRQRGLKDFVKANDSEAMNALLSVCRAMTQHPLDLTAKSYPASQIEYVPFFPSQLAVQKP